jgi:autotransporter translocation and assembly factor TamB
LKVRGSAGILPGYNIMLQGNVFLSALLPFFPAIDNLQGAVSSSLAVRGPLPAPDISGSLELVHGEIGLISPDVTIRDAQGSFELAKDEVKVKNLKGLVNDGELEVRGSLYPKNLAESELIASFSNVTISPMADTTLTVAENSLSAREIRGTRFWRETSPSRSLRSPVISIRTKC